MEKEYPWAITSSISMNNPNESFRIYDGEFKLINDKIEMNVIGKIMFNWVPAINVKIEGKIQQPEKNVFSVFKDEDKVYKVIIEGNYFGEAMFLSFTLSNELYVEGQLWGEVVRGDKTISVSKIIFSIPNLREFHGSPVKEIKKDNKIWGSRSRLLFENKDYKITIDKSNNYEDKIKLLKSNGGYLILYNGEIVKKKGNLKLSETKNLLDSFSVFLCLLNGRRVSPLLLHGIHDEQILWTDYSSYKTDNYKYVISWPAQFDIDGLNGLWNEFSILWKDENDKDFLNSVIHWYIEANSNSGLIEGSIIMIQTALELLYNYFIIEKKKMIIGKDGEWISAANKIRILLSQINVEKYKSYAFKNIETFIKSNERIIDEVEAFVYLRNAIVHSQEEKRKELSKISASLINEIQQLGLWYIEISLLYILKYEGKYYNRCSGAKWRGEGEYDSPYMKNKIN